MQKDTEGLLLFKVNIGESNVQKRRAKERKHISAQREGTFRDSNILDKFGRSRNGADD